MARELGWSISGLRNPDDAAAVDCQLHGSACMGQNNTEAVLTTIIVTRTRVELLKRALRSLEAQDLVRVELVVLVDDCPLTRRFLETLPTPSGAVQSVRWIYAERGPYNHSGPKRLAALRNLGLQMVETQWCSYLDDDNELEPLHFSTLLELITRSNAPATHSWRSLWTREGKPFFLTDRHPWCRNPDLAKTLFAQYQDTCIYQAGSNVVHDQVVPFCRHVSMVDMSEWLFETEFLRGIGFAGDYCTKDWETSRTEDSKLLDEIVMRGLRIPSTQKPTLKYYLGGYSNDWSNEAAQLEGWL